MAKQKYRYCVTFRDKEQKDKFKKFCKLNRISMYAMFRELIDRAAN